MHIDLILIILMVIIEIILGSYGLLNGFNNFILISMIVVAAICIITAYLINRRHSIYSGKFKDHFKE